MKIKALVIELVVLLFAVGASAQSAPAPVVQHAVISVDAAGYGSAKGTQAVSLVGGAFQFTSNVSLGYLRVSNPADSTQPVYNLGVANYSRELKALLGSKLSSKLAFDSSNFVVTFQAGGGKVNYAGASHVAEVGGIFLTRPVANNLALTCGYQVLHGQGTSILTRNTSSVPTVGLNFTF